MTPASQAARLVTSIRRSKDPGLPRGEDYTTTRKATLKDFGQTKFQHAHWWAGRNAVRTGVHVDGTGFPLAKAVASSLIINPLTMTLPST